MKTTTSRILLASALALGSVAAATAQTSSKKQATVHIKKVENINGVEKVTDTTYITSDPTAMMTIVSDDGSMQQDMIIINGPADGKKRTAEQTINETMEKMGIDPSDQKVKKTVVVNEVHSDDGKTSAMTKTVMIRVDLTDASEQDQKRLNSDNKLEVDNMIFYPNPNSGKFNLKFSLKQKGDAMISIYNTSGKQVYTENLAGFSGDYNKSIDISGNDKGIYFVKVEQNGHAMMKKIVLE